MNITKKNKNKINQDLSPQTKSFLIISSNYQIEALYNILKKTPSLVNTKDQKGETFLSYAIKRKNIEIAELILTSPVLDLSYQDKNGNSYLHLSVINQLENIIRTLIQKGINVNLQNNEGNTALHFAYSTGDIKFITIMIESKVDFTIKNQNGLIAEEVQPGTYKEILDINNGNNNNIGPNEVNITQNKNNTVTINLNVDSNDNRNSNVSNNANNEDKDNNGIIINERGQINKSIRINWDNNGNSTTNNKNNNNDIYTNNTNNNMINSNMIVNNALNDNNININNNIISKNESQLENNITKSKLKYSLVNFSYSDDGNESEEKEEIGENGIISQTNILKENDNNKENERENENNKENIIENKKKIKSSDIFDLTSSLSYQEKVANASFINAQIVGNPNILSKKDSNEIGINDINEDIVNINRIKTIENEENNSLNNNMINNGIEISQVSFQTAYQNGRNMNLSQINQDNGNVKSANFENNNYDNINMNSNKENGKNIVFDYSTSIIKEDQIYENVDMNENEIKRESENRFNFDNNAINANAIQSSTLRIQQELNQDFAFSPVTTLKEPLNKKINGSEININKSNMSNVNYQNNINNSNTNYISTINIDNEINSEKQKKTPENIDNIQAYSTNLRRCNALNDNKMNNSNKIKDKNSSNDLQNKDNDNVDNENLINMTRTTPTKNNNIHSINTNLSQVSQNNINSKTNSKFDFNCPVNVSEETVNSSTMKNTKSALYKFLSEIRMEKYHDTMSLNGFDDINLLISQTKSGHGINDKQLKEAGINKPGDRAKILLRLQEKAGNFIFPVPREVYYICQSENYKNDRNIKKLNDWLKALKIEIYLDNFVKNGYHSIELMLLQSESKNPINDEILRDELGINKIGHRSRIINKLLEEAKSLNNKLKTSMLVMGNVLTDKICDCIIY